MDPDPKHTSRPGDARWAAQRERLEQQRQQNADEKAALFMALMSGKNVMRSVAARLAQGDLDPAVISGLVATLNQEADHDEQVLAENDSLRPWLREVA